MPPVKQHLAAIRRSATGSVVRAAPDPWWRLNLRDHGNLGFGAVAHADEYWAAFFGAGGAEHDPPGGPVGIVQLRRCCTVPGPPAAHSEPLLSSRTPHHSH